MTRRTSYLADCTALMRVVLPICLPAFLLSIIFALRLPAMQALAAGHVSGSVYNVSGKPVPQAWVTVETTATLQGPDVFTASTDAQGRFRFPAGLTAVANPTQQVTVRAPGYEVERILTGETDDGQALTVILRNTAD